MEKIRKITTVTILTSLAIAINIVENIFIPELPFGVRFGLANILSIIIINIYSYKELIILNVLRVTIANLITGNILGSRFLIGLGGIILSTIILIVLKKYKTSIVFSSIISSILHTLGQIIVVCIIYNTVYMIGIIPIYVISSIGTGILTGVISNIILKRIKI